MSALSADRQTAREPGGLVSAPMAAVVIFVGSLVCLNASGYAAPAADSASFIFAGVANEYVDNSAGNAGDESIDLLTEGVFHFAASGLSITDVGKPLYVLDDQTVVTGDNGTITKGIYVGTLAYYESATVAPVRLDVTSPARRRAAGTAQQLAVRAAGVNAAALDLTASAAKHGGSDIYVTDVVHLTSNNTTAGNAEALIETTDFTIASGVITLTADRSAAGTIITGVVLGRLEE